MADANRHATPSKRGDGSGSSARKAHERDRIAAAATQRRRRAQSWGLAAETWAALWLRLKGYRILARRARTPAGEIDLVVRRGTVLVAVEVKARAMRSRWRVDTAAMDASRLARALDLVAARDPALAALSRRLDLVAVRTWRLPVHLIDLHRENR